MHTRIIRREPLFSHTAGQRKESPPMNRPVAWIVLFCGLLSASLASAQPALDRLEQRIRQQVQAANPPVAKQPGYLGLVADDREDRGRGARLIEVVPEGPAAKAGLQAGDLITAVNDQPVRDLDSMQKLLETRPAGAVINLSVTRDGGNRRIAVTLGERPPADKRRLPEFGQTARRASAAGRERSASRPIVRRPLVRLAAATAW